MLFYTAQQSTNLLWLLSVFSPHGVWSERGVQSFSLQDFFLKKSINVEALLSVLILPSMHRWCHFVHMLWNVIHISPLQTERMVKQWNLEVIPYLIPFQAVGGRLYCEWLVWQTCRKKKARTETVVKMNYRSLYNSFGNVYLQETRFPPTSHNLEWAPCSWFGSIHSTVPLVHVLTGPKI